MDSGAPSRSGDPDRSRPACRGPLSLAPRDRRRRAGLRPRGPRARDRARSGARALRRPRPAGRGVRHLAPRPPAERHPARVPRRRGRRPHHRGRRVGRLAAGRSADRRRGRARRHRRPAGRRGGRGDPRSAAAAAADPARAPGREPPERRDGAPRLSHRGRGCRRTVTLGHTGPIVALMAVGSPIAGWLLARLYLLGTARVRDAASSTVLTFVGTFGVWLLAERVGLSPIITMVTYGMALSREASRRATARNRISTYSVWETAVFVLNVLAFVIMGLQARPILNRLSRESLFHALLVSGAVLAAVIVVRIAYVMAYSTVARLKNRWVGVALTPGMAPPTVAGGLLVSWCGMRGLVTLATAFALPSGFPGRDLIVLSAFCVVLGTLVIQGFTLRPLLDRLGFETDGGVEREISRGRLGIMQAALDTLVEERSSAAAAVRDGYLAAREVAASPDEPQGATEHDRLRLRAITAQRLTLLRLREEGAIGDEAFHRMEEELDWAELDAAPAGSFQPLTTDGEAPGPRT